MRDWWAARAGGRPHALRGADRAFLDAALERGPQPFGLPLTVWSIRDLQALLVRERGATVSVDTVHRAVRDLGFYAPAGTQRNPLPRVVARRHASG